MKKTFLLKNVSCIAIFGDKSREVRDTSLRVPHGADGVVRDVKIFTRANGDRIAIWCQHAGSRIHRTKRKIKVGDKMAGRHGNKGLSLVSSL